MRRFHFRNSVGRLAWLAMFALPPALAAELTTLEVTRSEPDAWVASDAVVEAVRQTQISAQVAGRITGLSVKAGDIVRAGQALAHIDETAAVQQAAASRAQVASAQAQLDAARQEYERSRKLYDKAYISAAAMERAEAQFKSATAQSQALVAQADAAVTQTAFHFVKAPYTGMVATVTVELGDMAMPGKPLLTLYDPSNLRVVAHLPETRSARLAPGTSVRIELPSAPEALRWQSSDRITLLPTADPASHTVDMRIALPAMPSSIVPGTFARVYFPGGDGAKTAILVPVSSVIKRTELDAVYVVDAKGNASLRQVRLGHKVGDRIEVMAGLAPGERVALDPLAAARQHP